MGGPPLRLHLLGDLRAHHTVYHLALELSDEGIKLGHFQAALFFTIHTQTEIKVIYGLPFFFLTQNENADS